MRLIVIGIITVLTLLTICKIAYVNVVNKKGWGEYSTKLIGITFIVAIALIAFIYDASSNNSALFTLLGTLAGYFLGYQKKKKEGNTKKEKNEKVSK